MFKSFDLNLLFSLFILISCNQQKSTPIQAEKPQTEQLACDVSNTQMSTETDSAMSIDPYSFFAAGHVYGHPSRVYSGNRYVGIYPPFVEKFKDLNSNPDVLFGFFTGDFELFSEKTFDDLINLSMPIYFVKGNHDRSKEVQAVFENRYGNSYYKKVLKKDLFIVLDGNISHWNIQGEQLEFLMDSIRNATNEVKNIFIFVHQIIWTKNIHPYDQTSPNSNDLLEGETNYWSEIEPFLKQQKNKEVFLISGDVGVFPRNANCLYVEDQNLHYLTSGMGASGLTSNDNFLMFNVDKDRNVEIQAVYLKSGTIAPARDFCIGGG